MEFLSILVPRLLAQLSQAGEHFFDGTIEGLASLPDDDQDGIIPANGADNFGQARSSKAAATAWLYRAGLDDNQVPAYQHRPHNH